MKPTSPLSSPKAARVALGSPKAARAEPTGAAAATASVDAPDASIVEKRPEEEDVQPESEQSSPSPAPFSALPAISSLQTSDLNPPSESASPVLPAIGEDAPSAEDAPKSAATAARASEAVSSASSPTTESSSIAGPQTPVAPASVVDAAEKEDKLAVADAAAPAGEGAAEVTAEGEPHPLSWAYQMFFADTSPTKSKKSASSQAAAYSHGLEPLFASRTLEEFCGGWKAWRSLLRSVVDTDEGLSGLKVDSNAYVFREGIAPMWEDRINSKGGRLTISTSRQQLDSVFTACVLLLVGSVLEIDALPTEPSHGVICGVVASRRARGDRIEIWLGGEEAPDKDWVERLKSVLARELEMPEIESGRYKQHYS